MTPRRALLCASAGLLAACGSAAPQSSGTSASPTPVPLSVPDRVQVAQNWIRSGPYHFVENFSQRTSGTNLSDNVVQALHGNPNSSLTFVSTGDVVSVQHAMASVNAQGWNSTLTFVENGCDAYASDNANAYVTGSRVRIATLEVIPSFDDGLLSLAWQDQGSTRIDNTTADHLSAQMTALGTSGTRPSPNATPPPGITVDPTTVDLYIAPNGSLVEFDEQLKTTEDLAAGGGLTGLTGTLRGSLSVKVVFTPSGLAGITPPDSAAPQTAPPTASPTPIEIPPVSPSATAPPAPSDGVSWIEGMFGEFGVEKDSCS